jgi:hypothetical protein
MKRKTSLLPTKVYKYGLLAPIENVQLVDQAFYLGGKFYNKLIEIERASRGEYRLERASRFPDLDKIEKEVAAFTDGKKDHRGKNQSRQDYHAVAPRTPRAGRPIRDPGRLLQDSKT